jgi:signal transduction histidine kinase
VFGPTRIISLCYPLSMKREPGTDLSTRARSLRRLKWSAVLFPALFIWSSETVRHRFFDEAPVWLGNLITASVALLGSYLFAHLMFRLIERVDAAVVARNRRLATLYALASLANEASDEATLLDASLPIIRDVFSADAATFVPRQPAATDGVDAIALVHDGVAIGWLAIRGGRSTPDSTLLSAIGETLSVALANRRLMSETRRLAVLEERDRIARELHDGLAQSLAAITLQSARARAALADGNPQATRVAVDRIEHASTTAYVDVREAIVGLRTGAEPDFPDALQQTADWFSDTTGIAVHVDADLAPGALPPMADLHFLRVVQESLTNVRKHARATEVWIVATHDAEGVLRLSVRDNGVGFDPDDVPRGGRQHFGLLIMRERVESFGGALTITTAPGVGTTIAATLPNIAAARGAA